MKGVSLGIIGVVILVIFAIAVVAAFVFWIAMLVDVIRNPRLSTQARVIWFVVVFFLHLLGALTYYFVGRRLHPA